MMGLRGITIIATAGDTGVGAACQSNNNNGSKPTPQSPLPGSYPYVRTVGGTQSSNPEIAWTNGSGQFSNYFPQPTYQQSIVQPIRIDPSTLIYRTPFSNASDRAFSDVAAHSLSPQYIGIYEGQTLNNGGTSAAASIWAGIIGLFNDARIHSGKLALG